MEHQPSEVCDLMPCKLNWCQLKFNGWAFSSIKHNDELKYQLSIKPIFSCSVVSMIPTEKWRIQSVMDKVRNPYISLFQFWAPIKINGSTFLSTADQPFTFYKKLDKTLSSYRRICLDTLIPIDKGIPFGPPARVFSRRLPEYNLNVSSYSSAEFPLPQTAIPLGIVSYYAFPVFNLHNQRCVGVFEIVSTKRYLRLPSLIMGSNFESVGLHIPASLDIIFGPSMQLDYKRLGDIKAGLYEILEIHSLPFAQIWIPFSRSPSSKVVYRAAASIYHEHLSSMYDDFEYSSKVCFIKSGEALVGRAFASQGSCFCKDVTLLSIEEYPLLPSARKARFTQSFAICLQSKFANNFVFVVEYFLPRNEMFARDTKTFLNMLLSTMKEQYPDFIFAPGNELGQRMLVEVIKVSPSDELDSFEIGQTLPSVQSLQDGGEAISIDSFCQQKKFIAALALVISSCSSDKRDSLNCEGTVEVDPSLPHPIEEAVTNRGTVNVDVAHDDHIEDTTEMMQLDSHFEQPNLEINSAGARSNDTVEHMDFSYARQSVEAEAINRENNFVSGAMTNNEKIHSQKNNELQRIEKDHGITRETLEQQYGKLLKDAAKNLGVSRATLKRICRVYEITRWPHHKTRKVNVHLFKVLNHMWSINNVLLFPKKKAPNIWVTKDLLQQEYLVMV